MKVSLRNPLAPRTLKVCSAPYGVYILRGTMGLPIAFKLGDVVIVSHSWTRNCDNRKLILLRDPSISYALVVGHEGYNAELLEVPVNEIVITP